MQFYQDLKALILDQTSIMANLLLVEVDQNLQKANMSSFQELYLQYKEKPV